MKAFGMTWAGGALLGCSLLTTSAFAGDRTATLVVKDVNGQSLTNVGVYYTSDGAANKASFAGETATLTNLGDKVTLVIESTTLGNHSTSFRLASDADVTAMLDGAGNIALKVDQFDPMPSNPAEFRYGDGNHSAVGVNGSNSCGTASAIAGQGAFPFDNTGATTDGLGHPACTFFGVDTVRNDIWYLWTADDTGNATIDLCDATVDTKLAVYNNVACPPGSGDLLACNDDACGTGALRSQVVVPVTNGTQYLIRAGAFSTTGFGSGNLNISIAGGGGGGGMCTTGVGCQLPDQAGHGGGGTLAATSDRDAGFVCAENFTTTGAGSITSLCIWGAYFNFGTGTDCSPSTDDFIVTYYADAAGSPGGIIAGPFSLIPSVKVATGLLLAGFLPEWEFQFDHAAVPVSAGSCVWVEVSNGNNGDCSWVWSTAPAGDNRSAQNFAATDFDLAFCVDVGITSDGCGIPPPPDNDLCADAAALGALPASVNGDTSFATPDTAPLCVVAPAGPGVWYSVTGTGNTITASTCANPAYDTKLNVYCGGCDDLTCVAGNDDLCAFQSEVSWCSQGGVEYLILVNGFGAADAGPFTLDVTDNGIACGGAVDCAPTGACCIGAGGVDCTVVSAADCLALGGEYVGDGTVCSGYTAADCANAFLDISGMTPNLGLGDDTGLVVPIGFTFDFFGSAKTTIGVCSNGYLTFGATLGDFTNDPIPTAATPNDIICPLWDDFSPNQGGSVHAMTMGVAPNRTFVAQWNNVPQFNAGDSNTFQAILFEADDSIEFRYGTFSGTVTPTVGVENADGSGGLSVGTPAVGDCVRISSVTSPCPIPECFLVFGYGAGSQPFTAGGHTWQTQLSGVYNFEETLMEDLPVMQIPPYNSTNGNGSPFGIRRLPRGWTENVPVNQFAVQVLMWNPEVFPSNPEQHSYVMSVVVWANGAVQTALSGTRDNIDITSETFYGTDGTHYLRFPFVIEGF